MNYKNLKEFKVKIYKNDELLDERVIFTEDEDVNLIKVSPSNKFDKFVKIPIVTKTIEVICVILMLCILGAAF